MRAPVEPLASPAESITLDQLAKNSRAVVLRVTSDRQDQMISMRLADLGFVTGARVRVMTKGLSSSAPIAVRIGSDASGTTFALRKFEAALIAVDAVEYE
jgi:ferrous iron transport protein A